MPIAAPPRLVERVLTLLLGDAPSAPFIVGDLREEFAERAEVGPVRAIGWYCKESFRIGVRLRAARRKSIRTSIRSGRRSPGGR